MSRKKLYLKSVRVVYDGIALFDAIAYLKDGIALFDAIAVII